MVAFSQVHDGPLDAAPPERNKKLHDILRKHRGEVIILTPPRYDIGVQNERLSKHPMGSDHLPQKMKREPARIMGDSKVIQIEIRFHIDTY